MINMVRSIAPPATSGFTRLRGLVHEATLAASSHNTQPWKFKLGKRSIGIFPDLTRRCPVVDPDDHHLFVSLGCATENLVCGALANGLVRPRRRPGRSRRGRVRGHAAGSLGALRRAAGAAVHALDLRRGARLGRRPRAARTRGTGTGHPPGRPDRSIRHRDRARMCRPWHGGPDPRPEVRQGARDVDSVQRGGSGAHRRRAVDGGDRRALVPRDGSAACSCAAC